MIFFSRSTSSAMSAQAANYGLVAYLDPLSPGQFAVLRWINSGCPGTDAPPDHRQSAAVLEFKKLVKITKRGGWQAALTDGGRYYLKHNRMPPRYRIPAPRTPGGKTFQIPRPEIVYNPPRPPAPPPPPLQAPEADRYTVPLPRQADHPIAKKLKLKVDVWNSTQRRLFRIVQALINTALKNGWTVGPGANRMTDPVLIIDAGHCPVSVFLQQQTRSVRYRPTPEDLDEVLRHPQTHLPFNTAELLPLLTLRLHPEFPGQGGRTKWTESQTPNLHVVLSQVLEEIEAASARADRLRRDHAHELQQRREHWAKQRARAVEQATEQDRLHLMNNLCERLDTVARIRPHLQRLAAEADNLPTGPAKANAQAWLAWADSYIAGLEPSLSELVLPPAPDAATLAPWMDGLDPARPPDETLEDYYFRIKYGR
ncbi:hypothetical protein ACFQ36_07050 [Arthrobacter sp. GCM10027362]|uniref:hypothetical protein n=1 Tax=Arthrobacter sp. GCM10027362 TaxID=3273379 RepID=UPI0036395A1A